ncbi:MAG: hypothetical protein J1E61_00375 [Lachnospiraceae bacterium]|nr:hypothetical protein [Lachnospiraceae bacterium]
MRKKVFESVFVPLINMTHSASMHNIHAIVKGMLFKLLERIGIPLRRRLF